MSKAALLSLFGLWTLCVAATTGVSPSLEWRIGGAVEVVFPSGSRSFVLTRLTPGLDGSRVYSARDKNGARATFVVDGDDFVVRAPSADGFTTEVLSSRAGQVRARTVDARTFRPRCEPVQEIARNAPDLAYWKPVDPPESDGKDTLLNVIDVLIAYDAPAAQWLVSKGWTTGTFAEMEIAKLNEVLANSALDDAFRFRLVGARILSDLNVKQSAKDNATRFSLALRSMNDYSQMSLSEGAGLRGLVEARYATGADLAIVLADTGTKDGLLGASYGLVDSAYGWDSKENLKYCGRRAFGICEIGAVESGYVLQHEVGHILGAGHPSATQVNPSEIDCGPQLFNYSSAYLFDHAATRHVTLMGYAWDGYGGTDFVQVPVFSSPDLTYSDHGADTGIPLGVAGLYDNALTVRRSYANVARYRTHVFPDAELTEVTLTVLAAPGGSARGGGTYFAGGAVAVKAVPKTGYLFTGWYEVDESGGTNVCRSIADYRVASATVALGSKNISLLATFIKKDKKVDVIRSVTTAIPEDAFRAGETALLSGAVSAESASRATITATGLPKGLKIAADGTISGTPTTPGWFKTTFTARNESGATLKTVVTLKVANWKDAKLPFDEEYGAFIPGDPISLDFGFAAGATVTGLPSWMKWNKTTGTLYGTPPKPATNVVVFTRRDNAASFGGGKEVYRKASTILVTGPYPVLTLLAEGSGTGTLSGGGKYVANKTVNLKAVQDTVNAVAKKTTREKRKSAFAGWWDADGNLVSLAASCKYKMPAVDTILYGRFVTVEEDADSIWAALGETELSVEQPLVLTNLCGVALEWSFNREALSKTSVSVSGLPSGLKYDAKAARVTGAPTAVSSKNSKTGLLNPSKVKFKVTTAGKNVRTYPIDLYVMPLPVWAVGTFNGGGATCAATLTVSKTGKISGKIQESSNTWSLASSSFATGLWDEEEGAHDLVADLVAKCGKRVLTNQVAFTSGAVAGLATNESYAAVRNLWTTPEYKALAKKLYKSGAIAVENEMGTFTFRFTTSGTVSVAARFVGEPFGVYSTSVSAPICVFSSEEEDFLGLVHLHVAPYKSKKFGGFEATVEVTLDDDRPRLQFSGWVTPGL